MNLNDPVRWAVIDLLKMLDRSHGGREHAELLRIAQTLGVEIPPVDLVPDPAPDGEAEADGEVPESEQERVYQFLAGQTELVGLARIVAGLGIKRWTINSALYRLLKKGSVEHVGHDAWRVRGAG
jgi:hypothetical protein